MQADIDKFPHKVNIPWRNGDDINRWDKVCIECIINYGLPGGKYITTTSVNNMIFHFKDERDAIWFGLQSQ